MFLVLAKIITLILLFVILGSFVYPNDNKSYALPYIEITTPLSKDDIQINHNQICLHFDNKASNAIRVFDNMTGQNKTQYFNYNPDSSVTVSNSSIFVNSKIQRPLVNDPNTVEIVPFSFSIPVKFVKNYDENSTFPSKTYAATEDNWTFGNKTYDKLNVQVNIPKDMDQYQALLIIFPSMNS